MSEAGRRILARIREANRDREVSEHPGDFGSWSGPGGDGAAGGAGDPVVRFSAMFEGAGGEVVRVADGEAATVWLAAFAEAFETVTVGVGVDEALVPRRRLVAPRRAALAVSRACCAVAETGSLVLDARDGRRVQLLAPVHVVLLDAGAIHATMRDAFLAVGDDLPSALGLHSGPSKSADIGQVMVKGVHGPGRLVAVVIGSTA
jgi:L-lactate dehydrogenase complex protein LldG